MTLSAYPFDGVDTTENEYSTLFHVLQDDGFNGLPTGTAGKCTAASGMEVSVAARDIAILAGFAAINTAPIAKTLTAGGGQPRIDRVVLRINPTSNDIGVEVLQGDPGAIPVAPALTQVPGGMWEIPIARIAVAASMVNVTNAEITDERDFLPLRIGAHTTANRKKNPVKGQLAFNHTANKWEWYDGAAWVDLSPSSIDAAILTGTIDVARLPVVPVAKGGTGSNTAAGARTNLEITPANIGAATSGHTHDDRYYTETETNSLLNAKANTSHTHDDRYFTEAEVTSLLSGKAATSHTHSSLTSGGSTWYYSSGAWRTANRVYASDSIETDQYMRAGAAWGYNITGTRRAMWMDSSGTFGHTDSSAKGKRGITVVDGTIPDGAIVLSREQLRLLQVVSYQRVQELAREKKEPGYRAPVEIGVVAEQLHEAGLWPFVMYEGRGSDAVPIGVHYEILALAGIQLAQFVADDVDELRREIEGVRTQLGGAR